jgi:hypothetical protein
MGKNNLISIGFCFLSLFCLYSCGLEDYLYIDYVPDISQQDDTYARFRLPSSSDEGYSSFFANFAIYYRIYISGNSVTGIINTATVMEQINSYLRSDIAGLSYLADKTSTSANPSNLESVFTNRKFFKLTLEEDKVDNVLSKGAGLLPSSLGKILEIRFPPNPGEKPMLILDGVPYTLRRASDSDLPFLLQSTNPNNKFFLNNEDLYKDENITNDRNADVAAPNRGTPETPRYTYVSMYIFAIGKDYISTIYSQPTFIGIFRLADERV